MKGPLRRTHVSMTARDDEAFRSYVLARQRALRRAAFLMSGDWHLADDLVQNTLARLHTRWHRIDSEKGPDAYAHRILANLVIDERRKSWRREVIVDQVFDVVDPPAVSSSVEQRLDLLGALSRLPRGQRVVLVMRYWMDASVHQTAAALGCSEGTVKSQTAKGLHHLRAYLDLADPIEKIEECR